MSEFSFGDKLARCRARDLSDEVYKAIMDHHEREEYWHSKAQKNHDEVVAEVRNEYESEISALKDRLRFCVGVLNSDKELDAYNEFCRKHMECRMDTKYHGGMIPYITQYGTGIGVCTTVHCQVCGAKEDITDDTFW